MRDEEIMTMLRAIDPLAVRLPPYTRKLAVSAYAAGRRAGAEEMRERAAKVCNETEYFDDDPTFAVAAIRALPIEGGK